MVLLRIDLIEFTGRLLASSLPSTRQLWFEMLNRVLESRGCAYRFIAERLAPIRNSVEAAEVARGAESAIPAVAAHLREALRLLPPNVRANPRASIKESISAVEAALQHLTNNPSATLNAGLAAFEARYGPLHPSLRQGFVRLYGYVTDERGVQPALVDEPVVVSSDDAHFMLVSCSALTNYLLTLSANTRRAAS
jgi:hypothetical protein